MNEYFNSPLRRFRTIALLEGISFIILLGIAMPLKYFAGFDAAVKYFGWMHGILFVLYIIFLLQFWEKSKWSFGKVCIAFLASLLPFGTFVLDHKWLKPMLAKEEKPANP
jgi:integral membrane protein